MSEWITDRLPTKDDSFANQVIISWDDGSMCMTHFKNIEEGMPWTSIPKPAPYIKPEPQRWKPAVQQLCYYFTLFGDIQMGDFSDNLIDGKQYDFGNCFQTSTQAHEAARRVRELLLKYHKELNNA